MSACDLFRARLERVLADPSAHGGLQALGWQEHLFTCEDCRGMLAAEEALESLLGVLPEVHLPEDLTARVLARLRARSAGSPAAGPADVGSERHEHALDRLLSRADAPGPPGDLGARTLRGLREIRSDEALERLLERVEVGAPPTALVGDVLRAVESERARRTELLGLGPRWGWAAAALALLTCGAWILSGGPQPDVSDDGGLRVAVEDEVDPELLAALDVLENWELLLSDDVDVLLGGLGTFGDVAAGDLTAFPQDDLGQGDPSGERAR